MCLCARSTCATPPEWQRGSASASFATRAARSCARSAVTLAELAAGPHATADPAERARRQERLQRTEATLEPLPVDAGVARAYGRVYAAVGAAGRKERGR